MKKPTNVSPVDRNTILVENETNEFLNYNGEVFQLKNKEGNSSVYMKIATEKNSKILIWIGISLLIIGLFLLFFGEGVV